MKIGTQHRNKIWRSLVEFRSNMNYAAGMCRSSSNASTVTIPSQNAYCPGYYEVTRYTFKHTISATKKEQDHDYC